MAKDSGYLWYGHQLDREPDEVKDFLKTPLGRAIGRGTQNCAENVRLLRLDVMAIGSVTAQQLKLMKLAIVLLSVIAGLLAALFVTMFLSTFL